MNLFASIKFRLILFISLVFILLLVIFAFTAKQIEKQLVFAFEERVLSEQFNLLRGIKGTHTEALMARICPWLIPENITPLFIFIIGLFLLIWILLKPLSQNFEHMVATIQESELNMKRLLFSLREGIFFFDHKGVIAKERSQALGEILPDSSSINNVFDFFQKYTGKSKETVETVLNTLWEDGDLLSTFKFTVAILGRTFNIAKDGQQRSILLEYRELLGADNNLDKVVVLVTDVTEKIKIEKEQLRHEERIRKISMATSNLESYRVFETHNSVLIQKILEDLKNANEIDFLVIKMAIHTAKGNLATFEFQSLASFIHQFEDKFVKESLKDDRENIIKIWEKVQQDWQQEINEIDSVLGLSQADKYIRIDRNKIAHLVQSIKDKEDNCIILEKANQLFRYPLPEVMQKYQKMIEKLARRFGKEVRVIYEQNSCELAFEEIKVLDPVFVHLFRNCINHGIEPKDVRMESRKQAKGTIKICALRKDDKLEFKISDDGFGINTCRLVEKAITNGIWDPNYAFHGTDEEKINLIFEPEISTVDEKSDVSGRGIGMAAVKRTVEDAGGSITVHSEVGKGTSFTILV